MRRNVTRFSCGLNEQVVVRSFLVPTLKIMKGCAGGVRPWDLSRTLRWSANAMSAQNMNPDGPKDGRLKKCAFCDWIGSLFNTPTQRRNRKRTVFSDLFWLMKADHDGTWNDDEPVKGQSDAYVLEVRMLNRMSDVELVARIQSLRRNLREMMVAHDYIELMKHIVEATGKCESPTDKLKFEARALLDRTYRRYLLVPKVEQMRASIGLRLLLVIGLMALATVGLLLLYFIYRSNGVGDLTFGFVLPVFAGSVGATISTLMRLHKMDPRRDPLMVWMSLHRGSASIWMSPVLGVVFGLIMLLVLRSGIVSGQAFPDFNLSYWDLGGVDRYIEECSRAASDEDDECRKLYRGYTALLVWCFVAGWAERLVPDVLDRLANQARAPIKGTGSG